jgi:AcrR family transcriptional regulator
MVSWLPGHEPLSPSRASRREAARKKVIDAAAACFAERTYRGTTLEAIAQAAGLSRMMLYRYFESKDDLYLAVLDQIAAVLTVELARMPRPPTAAGVTAIHLTAATEHPAAYRLFWERALAEAPSRAHIEVLQDEICTMTTEMLTMCVQLGPLAPWGGKVATRYLVGSVVAYLERPEQVSIEDVAALIAAGLDGMIASWNAATLASGNGSPTAGSRRQGKGMPS